jgi:uncharacterized protein (TIGR00255 family)
VPTLAASAEGALRALVPQHVTRGRVEVTVSIHSTRMPEVRVEWNAAVVEEVVRAVDRARDQGLIEGRLRAGDLFRVPHALVVREQSEPSTPDETLVPLVSAVADDALTALAAMRVQEGQYLAADLDTRRAGFAEAVERLAEAADAGQRGLGERLRARIADLRLELTDAATVAQEVVRFVSRSDIQEELVRLRAHLTHWTLLANGGEPCGRKLDFLLQEMNREVNTIGSKGEGTEVPAMVVHLKAELERMKEQVQNIE